MEPIINPMFFYWLPTINILGNVFEIFATLLTIVAIVMIVVKIFIEALSEEKDKIEFRKFPFKLIIFMWVSFLILAIFIPSKQTLIEMEVARNITYDRLDKVVEVGKDLKNSLKSDIIDIIKTINKEDE